MTEEARSFDSKNKIKTYHHPSCFDPSSRSELVHLECDKLVAQYLGRANHSNDYGCVRADQPLPNDIDIFYFEITVLPSVAPPKLDWSLRRDSDEDAAMDIDDDRESSAEMAVKMKLPSISIGLLLDVDALNYQLGSRGGCGYSSSAGKLLVEDNSYPKGPKFTVGDVVGCGVNFLIREIFYTLNGTYVKSHKFPKKEENLYPAIGLHSIGARARVNFGASPFKYDIEKQRFESDQKQLNSASNIRICPSEMEKIVLEYLLCEGYSSTYKSLQKAHESKSTALLRAALVTRTVTFESDRPTANSSSLPEANSPSLIEANSSGSAYKGRGGLNASSVSRVLGTHEMSRDGFYSMDTDECDDDDEDDVSEDDVGHCMDELISTVRETDYESEQFFLAEFQMGQISRQGTLPSTEFEHINSHYSMFARSEVHMELLKSNLDLRGSAMKSVMSGSISEAIEIFRTVPALSQRSDVRRALERQKFIELIRSRKESVALDFSRNFLYMESKAPSEVAESKPSHHKIKTMPYIDKKGTEKFDEIADDKEKINVCMGLMLYSDPSNSPYSPLLDINRRTKLAGWVNAAMVQCLVEGGVKNSCLRYRASSTLENLSNERLRSTVSELRGVRGNRGSLLPIEDEDIF